MFVWWAMGKTLAFQSIYYPRRSGSQLATVLNFTVVVLVDRMVDPPSHASIAMLRYAFVSANTKSETKRLGKWLIYACNLRFLEKSNSSLSTWDDKTISDASYRIHQLSLTNSLESKSQLPHNLKFPCLYFLFTCLSSIPPCNHLLPETATRKIPPHDGQRQPF